MKLQITDIEDSYLLRKMEEIMKTYREMGTYPYELYTLMSGIAMEESIPYDMERHSILLFRSIH